MNILLKLLFQQNKRINELKLALAKVRNYDRKQYKKLKIKLSNDYFLKNIFFKAKELNLNWKIRQHLDTIKSKDKIIKYDSITLQGKELLVKKLKESWFQRTFKKPKYYILYINPSENLEIIAVMEEVSTFTKNLELHKILRRICFYNGKPCFLIHSDIIVSLDLKLKKEQEYFLVWNAKEYYNIINFMIRRKLTHGDSFNFSEFFKKNWWILLIIVALVIFVLSPQGKSLIASWGKDLAVSKAKAGK
jgi:hypothetical protein